MIYFFSDHGRPLKHIGAVATNSLVVRCDIEHFLPINCNSHNRSPVELTHSDWANHVINVLEDIVNSHDLQSFQEESYSFPGSLWFLHNPNCNRNSCSTMESFLSFHITVKFRSVA